MSSQLFTVGGHSCSYKSVGEVTESFLKTRDDVVFCVCCKKPLLLTNPIGLLINNFKLFPNRMVHESCFKGQETIELLTKEYREYKALLHQYRAWQ
jgi:ABC-type polar amino acid transport system ATPase subunit